MLLNNWFSQIIEIIKELCVIFKMFELTLNKDAAQTSCGLLITPKKIL